MPKLPRLTAREICSVLEKFGFSITRQSGSHIIYENAEGKRATVPCREDSPPKSAEEHHARRRPKRRGLGTNAVSAAAGYSALPLALILAFSGQHFIIRRAAGEAALFGGQL